MPLTAYSLYLQKGAVVELVYTAMKKKACANQSLSLLFVFQFKLRALNMCSKSDFFLKNFGSYCRHSKGEVLFWK